jgi:mono/diheme cytochrome c family protein
MKARLAIIGGIVAIIISLLVIRTCSAPTNKGQLVYEEHCANCHGNNGEGFAMYPPLNNADYLLLNANSFACIVYYGLSDSIQVNGESYQVPMPSNTRLSETDLVNLANYVYEQFGNEEYQFNVKEIQMQLENCSSAD